MRLPGGAVIAPLISCSASGKALAESLRRWWQGFSLPPLHLINYHKNAKKLYKFDENKEPEVLINLIMERLLYRQDTEMILITDRSKVLSI
jgi:hypothetical protein